MTANDRRVTGFVFIAANARRGLIRVGFGSDPRGQFKALQTSSPDRLALTLVIPGTLHTHRALAAKLAGCHVSNGWYDAKAVAGILLSI